MRTRQETLSALMVTLASVAVTLVVASGCSRNGGGAAAENAGELVFRDLPPQPGEETWRFVNDLKTPMWTRQAWNKRRVGPGCADLSGGVTLRIGFADSKGRLETAYDDLRAFFAAGEVSSDDGSYTIETAQIGNLGSEAFRLQVGPKSCRILAADTEGIRRGIFRLEDEMLRQRGPFVPLGTTEYRPFVKDRISRCFFGPIKRLPKMRDELMDDVDYYPDQYLNRLAHEGVNGLWLTIEFRDLVKTTYTPEAGQNAERRLAKLRQTVAKCLRYGIKTYIFCIEPRAWDANSDVIKKYPELAGAPRGREVLFCPMSQTAHKYLYESVNKIFSAVPDLGGMINITHGERPTTCASAVSSTFDYKGRINCPRCSQKAPWEILFASLSAMEQGMHAAAPEAKLISWLYMPQPQRFSTGDSYELADWVHEIPAHTPKGVILQFNFESGVRTVEFGKELVGGDYWISNPGPSSRFERIAEIARANLTPVSAKIQTGNSHEVATTPYLQVPSLLYRKFSGMRRLGVSSTMLCWYFGNYPGLMNKAAGELSFEPFPKDEGAFLRQLASIYWKADDVPAVTEAWKSFGEGFQNYPLTNMFQYYGPMHDGPVWPLLLKPADAPLAPTWLLGPADKPWPPSGDRIGECLGEVLTLKETVELARRMSAAWDHGVEILKGLEPRYGNEPDRFLDIGVAQALGVQFGSGRNILRFYLLRDELLRMEGKERLKILDQMVGIMQEELDLDRSLLALCERDSRLGFHSEAEGYKYFPAKIRWRMNQVGNVLTADVPEFRRAIMADEPLFPEFTGKQPTGAVAYASRSPSPVWSLPRGELPKNLTWQLCDVGARDIGVQWAASYDAEAFYVTVRDLAASAWAAPASPVLSVQVKVEPQRLFPVKRFVFNATAGKPDDNVRVARGSDGLVVIMRIPLERIGLSVGGVHPIRMDVRVQRQEGGSAAWRPDNPVTSRLYLGTDNPADLGWVILQ